MNTRGSLQFVAVANAADRVRTASGAYSAGTARSAKGERVNALGDNLTQPSNSQ